MVHHVAKMHGMLKQVVHLSATHIDARMIIVNTVLAKGVCDSIVLHAHANERLHVPEGS